MAIVDVAALWFGRGVFALGALYAVLVVGAFVFDRVVARLKLTALVVEAARRVLHERERNRRST